MVELKQKLKTTCKCDNKSQKWANNARRRTFFLEKKMKKNLWLVIKR